MRRLRWYEFGPEVVLAIGLGLFTITEPHAAASGLKSTKTLVLIAAGAIAWVAARAATTYMLRWPVARIALFGVVALAILKIVVLPAYQDHTVVETLARATPISTGRLRGIDHRATGTVNLYRAGDGHVIVGLEDFDIQPGPAYVLYIVGGTDRHDHGGGTRLDRLRGNRGTQFYDAPTGIDLASSRWTVLVWCETFDVPVANATPAMS